MIWQAEINITQHLETVLQTLFKSSQEKIDKIQINIFKCSKLVGHFTDSNITLNLAFKTIKRLQAPNPGSISILNGLLIGHDPTRIVSNILMDTLEFLNEITLTVEVIIFHYFTKFSKRSLFFIFIESTSNQDNRLLQYFITIN